MRIIDWSSDVCSSDLRWLTLAPGDIDQACAWFDHHGGKAVFIGRLVPAVRTLISVPAGIAGMDLRRFLFFTALGTLVWTGFLAALGLDRKSVVSGKSLSVRVALCGRRFFHKQILQLSYTT